MVSQEDFAAALDEEIQQARKFIQEINEIPNPFQSIYTIDGEVSNIVDQLDLKQIER